MIKDATSPNGAISQWRRDHSVLQKQCSALSQKLCQVQTLESGAYTLFREGRLLPPRAQNNFSNQQGPTLFREGGVLPLVLKITFPTRKPCNVLLASECKALMKKPRATCRTTLFEKAIRLRYIGQNGS